MALLFKTTTNSTSRIGIVVSKKVGNAVVRNYYKRIFRVFYRTNKNLFLVGRDYIIIARKEILEYSNFLQDRFDFLRSFIREFTLYLIFYEYLKL